MKIFFEENPSADIFNKIFDGIATEAFLKRGLSKTEHFCFSLKSEDDQVRGAVTGIIYYGCMYIDGLWVDSEMRSKGCGKALMLQCERYASDKQCLFITVNTMDFEARPFYEKLGYEVEFEREGYLESSKLYFLRKNL